MRLPRVTAAEIITIIEKIGFSLSRQSGGDVVFPNNL